MDDKFEHCGLAVKILSDESCRNPLEDDDGVFITYHAERTAKESAEAADWACRDVVTA